MKFWLSCFSILWGILAHSQSFVNMNYAYGLDAMVVNSLFGSGVSAVDFDQDGVDDLTYALNGEIKFFRNDNLYCTELNLGVQATGVVKHVVWVDIDNDDDLDLFFTQYEEPNKLYLNTGDLVLVDISEQSGLSDFAAPHFGCSWGDYDRDGDLDLYVCTYIYLYEGDMPFAYSNHLYENLGDGIFNDVTLDAGVSDGISLSFQSVWFDENADGWPDLYVINDKEHPNRLYRNNQDGTFTELADSLGAAVALMDAMSASPGDYDNDGDLDLYISNTSIAPCKLLQKTAEGNFEDVASEANMELNVLAWGGVWFDPDLDGDLDIYVCEHNYNYNQLPNPYMRNLGNGAFVNTASSAFPFDYSNSYSGAACDWNSDGYPDLAISNISTQNGSLWINQGGSNHYLSLDLHGVMSNSKGVGAFIYCWNNGQVQSRLVMCGENYLGQNSNRVTFGLGSISTVDSLCIEWPSGYHDCFYNVPSGYFGEVVEGSGYVTGLFPQGSFHLCEGDSLVLSTAFHTNYAWSTGDSTQQISIAEPGVYWVTTTNSWGFQTSDSIIVFLEEPPSPDFSIEHVSCAGQNNGAVYFNNAENLEFLWEGEAIDSMVADLTSGSYVLNVLDNYGCSLDSVIVISEPELLELSLDELWCEQGLNVLVTTMGGTPPYSWLWSNGIETEDLISVPDSVIYSLSVTDQHNCSAQLTDVGCALDHRAIAQPRQLLYPNPTNGVIYFEGIQPQWVHIRDGLGRCCMKVWIEDGQFLDVSSLIPGVYFIRTTGANWHVVVR